MFLNSKINKMVSFISTLSVLGAVMSWVVFAFPAYSVLALLQKLDLTTMPTHPLSVPAH